MYQETIPKVRKHKSELGAKTGFRVEFVEIDVILVESGMENLRKQGPDHKSNILTCIQ